MTMTGKTRYKVDPKEILKSVSLAKNANVCSFIYYVNHIHK